MVGFMLFSFFLVIKLNKIVAKYKVNLEDPLIDNSPIPKSNH